MHLLSSPGDLCSGKMVEDNCAVRQAAYSSSLGFPWRPVRSLGTMCPEILSAPGELVHGTLYSTKLG